MPLFESNYSKTHTATDDNPFQVESSDVILYSCNIHCYDNDAYYGNAKELQAVLRKDDTIYFEHPIKINDWLFKNYTAGSNCKIVIIGTRLKE